MKLCNRFETFCKFYSLNIQDLVICARFWARYDMFRYAIIIIKAKSIIEICRRIIKWFCCKAVELVYLRPLLWIWSDVLVPLIMLWQVYEWECQTERKWERRNSWILLNLEYWTANIGGWSSIAAKEAAKYGKINFVLPKVSKYTNIPDQSTWKLDKNASYVYYCDNETANGIEFQHIPETDGIPLVVDMSSNLFTRPFDITKVSKMKIWPCICSNCLIKYVPNFILFRFGGDSLV